MCSAKITAVLQLFFRQISHNKFLKKMLFNIHTFLETVLLFWMAWNRMVWAWTSWFWKTLVDLDLTWTYSHWYERQVRNIKIFNTTSNFIFIPSQLFVYFFRQSTTFLRVFKPPKNLFPVLMHEHVHRHIKAEMHLFSEFSVNSNGHVL